MVKQIETPKHVLLEIERKNNYYISLCEKLPVTLKDYALARIGKPSFCNLSQKEQINQATDIITIAHYDNGDKGSVSTEVITAQTLALLGELKGKYGTFTVEEIKTAFKMGLRREFGDLFGVDDNKKEPGKRFGDFFGLNAVTYAKFLKCYWDLPQRGKSSLELLALIDADKLAQERKTKEQKDYLNKSYALKSFEAYKKGEEIIAAFATYDTVRSIVGPLLTSEENDKLTIEAKQKHKENIVKLKSEAIISTPDYLKALNDTNNFRLINIKKELALKLYFDKLIKDGNEMFEQCKTT